MMRECWRKNCFRNFSERNTYLLNLAFRHPGENASSNAPLYIGNPAHNFNGVRSFGLEVFRPDAEHHVDVVPRVVTGRTCPADSNHFGRILNGGN